jgi:serine/threonine protein kinase
MPWQSNKYVSLKITNCGEQEKKGTEEEIELSQHISQLHVQSSHEGRAYARLVTESFIIPGPFGENLCLVFEPLREPPWLLGKHLGSAGLPPMVLKVFLKLLLQGLDFLHSKCHIIHTS